MKRLKVKLRVNLEHGAIPIELAMAEAGFHRPDANESWLCGYYPVDGVDRYHEALTPPELATLADGTFDLTTKGIDRQWVEVVVYFKCTEREAEPPCLANTPTAT